MKTYKIAPQDTYGLILNTESEAFHHPRGKFAFPHRSLQEFLAALWLFKNGEHENVCHRKSLYKVILYLCGLLGNESAKLLRVIAMAADNQSENQQNNAVIDDYWINCLCEATDMMSSSMRDRNTDRQNDALTKFYNNVLQHLERLTCLHVTIEIKCLTVKPFLDLMVTNPNHHIWKRCTLLSFISAMTLISQYNNPEHIQTHVQQVLENIQGASEQFVPLFETLLRISQLPYIFHHFSGTDSIDNDCEMHLCMNEPYPSFTIKLLHVTPGTLVPPEPNYTEQLKSLAMDSYVWSAQLTVSCDGYVIMCVPEPISSNKKFHYTQKDGWSSTND